MRKALFSLVLLFSASNAWAYPTGTFSCRNLEGLPNNTYKIQQIDLGGVTVPHVEVTRYYKTGSETPPVIEEVKITGIATVSKNSSSENLMIASLRLEFVNGALSGCRQ